MLTALGGNNYEVAHSGVAMRQKMAGFSTALNIDQRLTRKWNICDAGLDNEEEN